MRSISILTRRAALAIVVVGCCTYHQHGMITSAQPTVVMDNKILQQLLQYAPDVETAKQAKSNDADAIFKLARLSKDKELSNRVLHILADYQEQPHTMSQITLAFHYYKNRQDKQTALAYFIKAGQGSGAVEPNQLALHNAGRVAAELGLWVDALTYSRLAAVFQPVMDPKVAAASKREWDDISKQISALHLSIEQAGELFLVAHLDGFPDAASETRGRWTSGIQSLTRFNQTISQSHRTRIDIKALEDAVADFQAAWESSKARASKLQIHLLLGQTNLALGYLAEFNETYSAMAAAHAEVFARSTFCYGLFASSSLESSCFNVAASAAVKYYQRANDTEGSTRALALGSAHPDAATLWKHVDQVPPVFYPSLTSKPLWDATHFQIATALQNAYAKQNDTILREIEAIKTLMPTQKGFSTTEIDATGEAVERSDHASVMQMIYSSPNSIIQIDDSVAGEVGGYIEVLSMHNGSEWIRQACQLLPTLCRTIQKHERRLCSENGKDGPSILQDCGAQTVVSILNIRPGIHVAPRYGKSNGRLTLHLCLEGCKGLKLSVRPDNADGSGYEQGHAVVFDDSYIHSLRHNGDNDAYVLVALLKHLDRAPN